MDGGSKFGRANRVAIRSEALADILFPVNQAPVAQGIEHPPSKRQVAGSNPAWGTRLVDDAPSPGRQSRRGIWKKNTTLWPVLFPGLAGLVAPCPASEKWLNHLLSNRRGHDRDDFCINEAAPAQNPLLQQASVVAFHDLQAACEIRLHPAIPRDRALGKRSPLIAQTTIDRRYGARGESLDHHEHHRRHLYASSRITNMILVSEAKPCR